MEQESLTIKDLLTVVFRHGRNQEQWEEYIECADDEDMLEINREGMDRVNRLMEYVVGYEKVEDFLERHSKRLTEYIETVGTEVVGEKFEKHLKVIMEEAIETAELLQSSKKASEEFLQSSKKISEDCGNANDSKEPHSVKYDDLAKNGTFDEITKGLNDIMTELESSGRINHVNVAHAHVFIRRLMELAVKSDKRDELFNTASELKRKFITLYNQVSKKHKEIWEKHAEELKEQEIKRQKERDEERAKQEFYKKELESAKQCDPEECLKLISNYMSHKSELGVCAHIMNLFDVVEENICNIKDKQRRVDLKTKMKKLIKNL